MQLTASQQRAVDAIDQSVGIIAGAGTGKTRVLVERCANLLAHDPQALPHLLAITFTERAALELRERLTARLPESLHTELHSATITTFHGFCMLVLSEHAPLLDYSPRFGLSDADHSHRLAATCIREALLRALDANDVTIRSLCARYPFATLCQHVHRLLDDRWNVYDCLRDHNVRLASELPEASPEEQEHHAQLLHALTICDQHYQHRKRTQQVMDFHDLEIYCLELLRDHPEVRADYQQRYHHLLVDEFQDTNFVQMEIVKLLYTPPDNTLCIVGDPKQSIYRFRGAQTDCFAHMLHHMSQFGGEVIHLQESFRSAPEIIGFVNTACTNIPNEQHLQATRHDIAGTVTWLALPSTGTSHERRVHEAQLVSKHIATLVATGEVRYGDIACLFPTHASAHYYARALSDANIPYHLYGGQGFLGSQCVTDVLAVLRWFHSFVTTADDAALLTALQTPLFGLSADQCYALRHLPIPDARSYEPEHDWPALHQRMLQHPKLGPCVERWVRWYRQLTTREFVEALIADTGYRSVVHALDPSGQELANLDKFLALADAAQADTPHTLADFLDTMSDLKRREARIAEQPVVLAGDNAVQLLTIHASKGNEFPVVYLADLEGKRSHRFAHTQFVPGLGLATQFEHSAGEHYAALQALDKAADSEERDRVLYVALTRAEQHLILPMAPSPEKPKPSWAQSLREGCLAQGIAETQLQDSPIAHDPAAQAEDQSEVQPSITAPVVARPQEWQLTVTQLETYARCPHEFFLKYVLQVPASTMHWPSAEDLPAELRGEIVHAAIARHHQGDQSPWEHVVREELTARGYHNVRPEHYAAMVTQLGKVHAPDPGQRHYVETPFRLPWTLGAHTRATITGTIDHLAQHEAGWAILDYKTDHAEDAAQAHTLADKYALQLGIYALAAQRAGFAPLLQTTLHFLHCDAQITQQLDANAQHTVTQDISQTIQGITEESYGIAADHTPPCAHCVYKHNGACDRAKC